MVPLYNMFSDHVLEDMERRHMLSRLQVTYTGEKVKRNAPRESLEDVPSGKQPHSELENHHVIFRYTNYSHFPWLC